MARRSSKPQPRRSVPTRFNSHHGERRPKGRRTAFAPLFERRYWRDYNRYGESTADHHHLAWLKGLPDGGPHVRRPSAPMRDRVRLARQRGQAMTEYMLLVTVLLFFLLFCDLWVEGSVIRHFMEQTGGFYQNSAHVACLPIP